MNKIERLRYDIEQLDKRLNNFMLAYNRFVLEQQDFNTKIGENMETIYNAFVKPELERQEKIKKSQESRIIVPN